MSLFIAAFGLGLGMLGLQRRRGTSTPAVPTGDGTMDFSSADNSALVALLEDI